MNAQTSNAPTWQGRGAEGTHGEASARILLDRLDSVQQSGKGWRARCPACDGKSRKLSIAESDGRVLVHCFAGCRADDVIGAVGLAWKDLMPPRHWPANPEEQRAQRRAMREAGWASALAVLATEATIARIAAAQMLRDEPLEWDDYCRLVKASELIDNAASIFVEARR